MSEVSRKKTESEPVPQNLYEAAELNENEGERQEIQKYTEWAASNLKNRIGVTDLSVIEGTYLRNTVERLMPKIKEEKKLAKEGKMSPLHVSEFEEEAAALWLYDMYGIHPNDIPRVIIVEDETVGKEYVFEKTMEQNSEEKFKEIQGLGHDAYVKVVIPEDFKKYIQSLRERAHHEK